MSVNSNTFSLLTFNINDESTSDSAPVSWNLTTQQARLADFIRERRPDLLCLQESFDEFPTRLIDLYDFHGFTSSHRGDCYIATRRDSPLQPDGEGFSVGPCVLVPLRLGTRRLYAGSLHLAPFPGGAPRRAEQLARAVSEVPPDLPLVLAGDTNMREPETGVAAEVGLLDAWVEAGCPGGQRWTWDTTVNRYYTGGHAYKARYDRVLFRGCGVEGLEVAANRPCSESATHFLSDHFALAAVVRLG